MIVGNTVLVLYGPPASPSPVTPLPWRVQLPVSTVRLRKAPREKNLFGPVYGSINKVICIEGDLLPPVNAFTQHTQMFS